MKKILILVLLLGILEARAQDLKKNEFGISIGYMFEGEVYLAEPNVYGSVGETFLLKGEFDHYFGEAGRFGAGAYTSFSRPWYDGYEEVTLVELGAVLKYRISAGEKIQIKPGAYIGFRAYGNNVGTGLGVNGSVAVQYQASEKFKPFIELGILSQPAGGNDATDITYSPVFAASVGVTF